MVVLAEDLDLCGAAVVCARVGAAASAVAMTRMPEMLPINFFTDPPIPLFESYPKKRRFGTVNGRNRMNLFSFGDGVENLTPRTAGV
jgi:hypothetical protein